MSDGPGPSADARRHREVLGHYPTGVAVVTSMDETGRPIGMVVGSFTSISLDPPLVGFLAARSSWSYARLRDRPRFCVNILGAHQGELCRVFSERDDYRFRTVDWLPSVGGSPVISECVAWIDCVTDQVHRLGDHDLVVGRVIELEAANPGLPLQFFRGGYGSFAPRSSILPPSDGDQADDDLARARATVEDRRHHLETAAQRLDREVVVLARDEDRMSLVASAGSDHSTTASVVGRRFPFVPPYGALFAAHGAGLDDWLSRLPVAPGRHDRDRAAAALTRVRERGWSVAVADPAQAAADRLIEAYTRGPHTPALTDQVRVAIAALARTYEVADEELTAARPIRQISVPVWHGGAEPVATLGVHSLSGPLVGADIERCGPVLADAAAAMSAGAPCSATVRPAFPTL